MANNVVVSLDPFKRGDTANFRFQFSNPYIGFDWTSITLDGAMTTIDAPSDNTGAAAVRVGQTLVTDAQGAHYDFSLTVTESKSLIVDSQYNVECQLKQGATSVATPATGRVKVIQDYVI